MTDDARTAAAGNALGNTVAITLSVLVLIAAIMVVLWIGNIGGLHRAKFPVMSPLFSRDRPSKRQTAKQERDQFEQIAKQGRDQFESLAIKAALGDADALQALPAAATRARGYYKNDESICAGYGQ